MRPTVEFDVLRPTTLADAASLLHRKRAMLVAGGTDVLPNLRRGLLATRWLVDLTALEGFDGITTTAAGWRIGAGLTLSALLQHEELIAALPALAEAAAAVAGPGHRSAATVGGNLCQSTRCVFFNQSEWWRAANSYCLKHQGDVCHVAPQGQRCHAAYQGDLAAALIACGAEAEIVGLEETRRLPLPALFKDDGAAHLTLAEHEIVAGVHVPHLTPGTRCGYRKMRTRGSMDFPLAGVGMALRLEGGRIVALTVGVTGTNSMPLRLEGTEVLLGRPVDEAAVESLGKLVAKQASPMRSTLVSGHHRRQVAVAAAGRLLKELAS